MFLKSQGGNLNEFAERKEIGCEIVCMHLAKVPHTQQRTRFLAIGLADSTVRIISLGPYVSLLLFCR